MGLTNTALPHDIARTFRVLVVAEVVADRVEARSAHEIEERLLTKDLHVMRASSLLDAETAVASDAGFSCVVLSWGLGAKELAQGLRVIDLVRRRTAGLPILLAMTREDRSRVPLAYVGNMGGFIWCYALNLSGVEGQLFFKHFGEGIFRNDLCNADVKLDTFEDAESFLGSVSRASAACVVADMRMPGSIGISS